MRESGGKRKEAGTAERFPPKKNFINGEAPVTVLVWGFYSQTPFTYYQNNKTNTITMGEIWGDNQKVTKRVKKVERRRKVNSAVKGEQWRTARIRRLQNFSTYKISQVAKISQPCFLLLLFFWFLLLFSSYF